MPCKADLFLMYIYIPNDSIHREHQVIWSDMQFPSIPVKVLPFTLPV